MNFNARYMASARAGGRLAGALRNTKNPYVRMGMGALAGVTAIGGAGNTFDRLRNRDVLGTMTNAALTGAAGYAAYNVVMHRNALRNHMFGAEAMLRKAGSRIRL